MQRVIAYIDGFNLYFGLREKGWRRYYWLDVHKLVSNLLLPDQELVGTKYFTSRISNPPARQKRQAQYIEALEMIPGLTIHYGQYQHYPSRCQKCGYSIQVPHEKMTDVNIAVQMLTDAFQDGFDTALLISADSDLSGPVSAVRQLFPRKRVIVGFPPARRSLELQRRANGCFTIGRGKVASSLLPIKVVKPGGFTLECPDRWK
jgi:uncharacterized LabA/DUF88 family protein